MAQFLEDEDGVKINLDDVQGQVVYSGNKYAVVGIATKPSGEQTRHVFERFDTMQEADAVVNTFHENDVTVLEDSRPAEQPTLTHTEHEEYLDKITEHIRANPTDLSMKSQHPDLHSAIHGGDDDATT